MHCVTGADHMDFAESDESEGEVSGRGDCGKNDGGEGGAVPNRLHFILVAKPDDYVDETHYRREETGPA